MQCAIPAPANSFPGARELIYFSACRAASFSSRWQPTCETSSVSCSCELRRGSRCAADPQLFRDRLKLLRESNPPLTAAFQSSAISVSHQSPSTCTLRRRALSIFRRKCMHRDINLVRNLYAAFSSLGTGAFKIQHRFQRHSPLYMPAIYSVEPRVCGSRERPTEIHFFPPRSR